MATMYFDGVTVMTIEDGRGDVIDIRFVFIASDARGNKALYEFDKNSTPDEQRNADRTLDRARLKKSNEKRVKHIGHVSSDSLKQDVKATHKTIANTSGVRAAASFVVQTRKTFTIRVKVLNKNDYVSHSFEVPFDGPAPGFNAIHGKLALQFTDANIIDQYEEGIAKIQSAQNP